MLAALTRGCQSANRRDGNKHRKDEREDEDSNPMGICSRNNEKSGRRERLCGEGNRRKRCTAEI
jgi:hypothetical protein